MLRVIILVFALCPMIAANSKADLVFQTPNGEIRSDWRKASISLLESYEAISRMFSARERKNRDQVEKDYRVALKKLADSLSLYRLTLKKVQSNKIDIGKLRKFEQELIERTLKSFRLETPRDTRDALEIGINEIRILQIILEKYRFSMTVEDLYDMHQIVSRSCRALIVGNAISLLLSTTKY